MPVTQCAVPADVRSGSIGRFANDPAHYYRSPSYQEHAAAARMKLESLRQELAAIHAANAPALENNAQVSARLRLLMTNIGIPESTAHYGYATPRARKMTRTVTEAGYLADLRTHCKMTDGYDVAVKLLEEFEKRIGEYERAESAKAQTEAREREARQEQSRKNRLLETLAARYDCTDIDAQEVLAAMLRQDRYLALSHALRRTRLDAGKDASLVQEALAAFTPNCAEDQVLVEDIEADVLAFTGDVRIFKPEAPLVYADKDIVEDYNLLQGLGLVSLL